ncbi:MAG TPA: peptidoglycan recognition protein [Actinomycetota bacterium]|nr:peptidoglycan recognition protein [Actinomycetota bacterium]
MRLALASAAAAALVAGGLPFAGRAAVPETVLRAVAVPSRALLPSGPGLALRSEGLAAATRVRTPAVRVCAPIWSTALALAWEQPAGGLVRALVRAGGRAARLAAEGGPDPGTPEFRPGERGTNLLWTGGGRCARISLALPGGAVVRDLRVLFLNSSGTAAGPGSGPPNEGPAAAAPAGLQAALAQTPDPVLVTREQWGADPALMNCTPGVADEVRMGFVHHTAGTNDYSPEESDDVVRAIYAYHTQGRGWCDIAYNFLIDRYGTVFEGRAGGPTLPVIGAATQGFNTGSFSVSMIGNFDAAAPPRPAMRALRRLLAWRLDVAHVPALGRATMVSGGGDNTRYAAGTLVRLPVIAGHRDTGYTDCPGEALYGRLPEIRPKVAVLGIPKIYRPRLSSEEVPPGTTDLRIRARGSEPLTWSVAAYDAGGALIATFPPATGDRLRLVWGGGSGTALPTAPGAYAVSIEARDAAGRIARPAVLTLLVGPPPSPSPTPSPGPTPSASATPSP